MNKNLVILIVVLVVIILGVWLWQSSSNPSSIESVGLTPSMDTTVAIDKDLQNVDVGNVDSTFQSIDTNLQSL